MAERATIRRGVGGRVGNALLTVAALGGALCIVLVPLALFFHISLIMFKTGSMSPTIPAGSLAVVREIPASQIHVGDVVTVDRDPAPPVTHRVTSVTPVGNNARMITLRGDANPTDDPAPYVVSRVRIVLFSAPQLAYAVRAVSNPLAMGAITVGAAALVTWAFWPKGDAAPRLRRTPRHAVVSHGPARHGAGVGPSALVLLVALTATLLGSAPPARAAETEDVIQGTYLTLTSVGDKELMGHLLPGVPVPWQIGVAAHPDRPGVVRISLAAHGELAADPAGLQVRVSVCTVRWVGASCSTGATVVRGPGPASSLLSSSVEVASMRSDEQRWILVDAGLPAEPLPPRVGSATIVVTASGTGDKVTTDGRVGPKPSTTGTDLRPTLFTGLGVMAAGLAITAIARLIGAWQRRNDEVTP